MIVDANYGLGESIVSGEAGVDHWVIDKQTGARVEEAIGHRRRRLEKLWTLAERGGSAAEERLHKELAQVVEEAAKSVLRHAYPHARKLLR